MKKLLSKAQYVKQESLNGADLWINSMYEAYLCKNVHKMERDCVSTSMYLYNVEASHFNNLVTSQETFITVRLRYLEHTIKRIQDIPMGLRDVERLRACIKARLWGEKMMREIRE